MTGRAALSFAVLMCAGAAAAHAQDEIARVDAIFADLNRTDGPGAAVAVVKDGRVVFERGYGLAQLEYGIPITSTTVFHVASVSKQFAAFAIVLLAQEGRLSLDDDIRKHLPEIHDFGPTITIRHLIHHTSGVRDQWELLMMAGWRLDDVITRDQIMALMRRQRELNFEPGAEYLYSNMGYTLLAEIIERVSGQEYGTFLHERVFAPLGMTSTHVHDDHEMIVPNRAYSYRPTDDGWRKAVLSYANQGATSLFTTVGDLAKWLVNMETARLGGAAGIAQMRTRGVLNDGDTIPYAFALSRGEHRGYTTWGHGGSDAGFRAQVVHFPEQRLGIIVLSNVSNGNPGRLALQIADVYLGVVAEEDSARPRPTAGGPPQRRQDEASWQPGIVALREYVGSYYSPELDVIYRIELRGDSLVAAHFKLGDLRVAPQAEAVFRLGSRTARFERAENGSVIAFRLTGGRVRNLLFVRLADGAVPRE